MKFKHLILIIFFYPIINHKIYAQDWSEFANIGYYSKANLELKLHSKN